MNINAQLVTEAADEKRPSPLHAVERHGFLRRFTGRDNTTEHSPV
jgi:hypothetical protein